MASVRLENISKKFDDVVAVDKINLTIKDGEFFSLLGPSGCGKTTILRMIAGFYHPTFGNIYFNDRDVSALPPNKRNTGMVFQSYALFPHMTVSENVAFGLRVRKINASERKQRVSDALKLVDLSGYEDRKVTQLSGGQQQRVALARAVVIEPSILLLDEPLSNLDAKLRRDTRDQIQRLQRELKITTVYVTHDQEEALTLSDRIALLRKGVCQQIGTPDEIYNHPSNAFVASFIGRSNLLEGKVLENEGIMLIKVEDDLKLNVSSQKKLEPDQNVTLAIRPETIMLHKNQESRLNTFEGVVELRQFNGYTVEYNIDVQGHKINVISLNEETQLYNTKDKVYAEFPVNRISIIPQTI
ncbi:polyamine ABC transporter ATP-binding protein [Candidatus Poribacteria bacterium]|nr:polyamine ABC transporter ATP-binding protein [Candidatus Poribacteria bacterium]